MHIGYHLMLRATIKLEIVVADARYIQLRNLIQLAPTPPPSQKKNTKEGKKKTNSM